MSQSSNRKTNSFTGCHFWGLNFSIQNRAIITSSNAIFIISKVFISFTLIVPHVQPTHNTQEQAHLINCLLPLTPPPLNPHPTRFLHQSSNSQHPLLMKTHQILYPDTTLWKLVTKAISPNQKHAQMVPFYNPFQKLFLLKHHGWTHVLYHCSKTSRMEKCYEPRVWCTTKKWNKESPSSHPSPKHHWFKMSVSDQKKMVMWNAVRRVGIANGYL